MGQEMQAPSQFLAHGRPQEMLMQNNPSPSVLSTVLPSGLRILGCLSLSCVETSSSRIIGA